MASYRVLKFTRIIKLQKFSTIVQHRSTCSDSFLYSWLVGGSLEEQESVVVTSSHSEEPTGDQFRSRVVTSNFLNLALAEIKERSLEQSKHTHTMHMRERDEGVEMVEII